MVEALLALGVDALVEGQNGTALQVAEQAGQEKVVQILSQMTRRSVSGQEDHITQALASARETARLNLSNLGLSGIPAEAFELTSLVELDLSHNQLTHLPPLISQFTALKSLKLDANRLTSLPSELGEMSWLEEVTLSLNTELAPMMKRKLRESLPALLEYLRSIRIVNEEKSPRPSAIRLTWGTKRGSVGESTILGLKEETPADEQLLRVIEEKERTLAKKEKKLNETIALVQEKNEGMKRMLAQVKEKEEGLKVREKELARLAHEVNHNKGKGEKKRSSGDRLLHSHVQLPALSVVPEDETHNPVPLLWRSHQQLSSDKSIESNGDTPHSPRRSGGKEAMKKIGSASGVDVSINTENGDLYVNLSSPGQQSLSLTLEQWNGLVQLMARVDPSLLQTNKMPGSE